MKSQFWAINSPSLPWKTLADDKPHIGATLRRLKAPRLLQLLILLVLDMSLLAALLLNGTFSHAITLNKSISSPASNPVAVKPSTPTAVASCGPDEQTDNTILFAACPSFALNFSAQPSGQLNTQLFNIYAGAPEANQEAQLYRDSPQNLRVANGNLQLEALNDAVQGYRYTSARVDTKSKEDFLYGKIVVRATMPNSIGSWPAIWMLPSTPKYASLSPGSDYTRYLNDGEIDIAESVGTEPHVVYGIAHSLAYPADGPNRNYYNTVTVPKNDTTYHNYEVDWTPTNLTFLVDGQPFFSISKQPGADYHSWPYDQPFYLILNLAVGGDWGGTDRTQFPLDGVDSSALPVTMNIQSIHYYPYIGK